MNARLVFGAIALSSLASGLPGMLDAAGMPPSPFGIEVKGNFSEPTAMAFLPETGARMNNCFLVTERAGNLKLWCEGGAIVTVSGTPIVSAKSGGGLIDVVAHPDFERNRLVYLAWVESGPGNTRGTVVGRAKLVNDEPVSDGVRLDGVTVLWRQELLSEDIERFGTRMAFGPDGFLYVSSGDRGDVKAAADLSRNPGKIVRLTAEGRPSGTFYPEGPVKASIWTLGHGNPAGLAFDAAGRLWAIEARSANDDALLLIRKGFAYHLPAAIAGCKMRARSTRRCVPKWPLYGWPMVIWNPPVQPTAMIVYSGKLFPAWRASALISGLTRNSLMRIKLTAGTAQRAEDFKLDIPFRAVAESGDGAVWLLEDKGNGRLLKLTPR